MPTSLRPTHRRGAARRKGLSTLLVTSLMLVATMFEVAAEASPAVETRYLDERARLSFQQEKYEQALTSFLAIYEITPNASAAYNIAVCAERAGDSALAFSALKDYFQLASRTHPTFVEAGRLKAQLSEQLALVEVQSDPPGAKIYFDRKDLGSYGITPATVVVSPANHHLILEAEDFKTDNVVVFAERGATVKVSRKLDPELVAVNLDANVDSATFAVTVRNKTYQLEAGTHYIPSGSWAIRAYAEGYIDQEMRISTSPSAERKDVVPIHLRLQKAPPPMGRLLVDTEGTAARVEVDGRFRGETPLTLTLPEGLHSLRLIASGHFPESAEIEVVKERSIYHHVTMTELPEGQRARSVKRSAGPE